MEPVTLTYGKKRGLLTSLGSRHRQKSLVNATNGRKTERIAPSGDARHETVQQGHPTESKAPASAVEEIENNSLDDPAATPRRYSTYPGHDNLASAYSVTSSLERSVPELANHQSDLTPSPITGCSLTPRGTRRVRDFRLQMSRVQKSPSKSPSKMTARLREMTASDYSPSRKSRGLLRPIQGPSQAHSREANQTVAVDKKTLGPSHHYTTKSRPPTRDEWKTSHPVIIRASGPDEIQEKVSAMLATTDALKPPPAQLKASASSRMARFDPLKVFTRVSSAWERMNSKASDEGCKARSKFLRKSVHDDTGELIVPPTHCETAPSRSTSSINTMDIYLNEVGNFNRKKVQKIVGLRIGRKPVADYGKSIGGSRPVQSSFAEPAQIQNQSLAENEPRAKVEIQDKVKPAGPFESETGFEEDLEDRILSTLPIGSSTPRRKAQGAQRLDMKKGSDKSCLERDEADLGAEAVIEHMEYELCGVQTPRKKRMEVEHREHVQIARAPRNALRARQDMDWRRVAGMKKHPSPSKDALEDLQMAFRQYSELKRCGAEEEVDELAKQWARPGLLSPRDENRLMRGRAKVEDNKHGEPADSDCEGGSLQKTRIPGPVGAQMNWRASIRLAPAYRPMISQPDETDELQ